MSVLFKNNFNDWVIAANIGPMLYFNSMLTASKKTLTTMVANNNNNPLKQMNINNLI